MDMDDFHTFLSAILVIQAPYCQPSTLTLPCFQYLDFGLVGTLEILDKTLIRRLIEV